MMIPDRSRCLDELDPPAWDAPEGATHTVRECHRLRAVAIGGLGVEDLRLLIGQGIGLPWLLPLAVERLEDEPLAEGDFYPGDLLVGVLRVPDAEWVRSNDLLERVARIVASLGATPKEIAGEISAWIHVHGAE